MVTLPDGIIEIKPISFHWETKDPFLFCAHHKDSYPEGNDKMGPSHGLKGRSLGNDFSSKDGWSMYHGECVPGFPVHPHRGFETITVVLEGFIDHTDSSGAAGRYGNGDVQWMTAGKGLQHAEMFPLINNDKPNRLELFQIWLNLPSSKKHVEPYFKMLWKESIPIETFSDENGKNTEVITITGHILGQAVDAPSKDSWAADPSNEVAIIRLKLEPGARFVIPTSSEGINRMLFFYEGETTEINGQYVEEGNSIDLRPTTEINIINGNVESELMLLQGKPINEPVVQYGPFVMNSQHEILETIRDYRMTEFGGWPWENEDQVHSREQIRFAKYQDGTIDKPSDH
jgi:redox-sensitive bicupin YhaK (pirin superfamily)